MSGMQASSDILLLDGASKQSSFKRASTAAAPAAADSNSSTEQSFLIGTEVAEDDAEEGCLMQHFEASMVAQGLSQLGRSASGGHVAYQRLELAHTDLQDPQALVHCQHVLQLVLSHNCLTTLQPLSQLPHLTSLDASHNRLTQVLDCAPAVQAHGSLPSSSGSSKLRRADLSFNRINSIADLSCHTNLTELLLAGNKLQRIGSGLRQLHKLRRLDVSSSSIKKLDGLSGLTGLQELSFSGNRISSLHHLSSLSGLQVLRAAHNQIQQLEGIQGLSALCVLDVSGNQLRRVEVLAACRGLGLLTQLQLSGNPLQEAQNARLHVIHMLTQLQQLDGVEVAVAERVEASNLVGAATDQLVQIRKAFFPHGELEDGGGAIPPTAAGLKASQAEEEGSCTGVAAMFGAIDRWAHSVHPKLALQPLPAATGFSASRAASLSSQALAAAALPLPSASQRPSSTGQPPVHPQSAGSSRRGSSTAAGSPPLSAGSSRRGSNGGNSSRPSSNEGSRLRQLSAKLAAAAQPGGIAAIAARLAAGCCPQGPHRQLQLLRVCHSWVLAHVRLPQDCDLEAGADLVTWDVERHVFGEREQDVVLHKVLLPGYTGTWAECVSQLLVSLLQACGLEAQQLSGFWKAGGSANVAPGDRLASHNHSWARFQQPLPFFLPPEAFIHTHLPFEPCWQLLQQRVVNEDWWGRPALELGFAAAGGRLLDGGSLRACVELLLDSKSSALPTLRIPLAAAVDPHTQLNISLLDANNQPLATWRQQQPQQCCCSSGTGPCSAAGCCLVFQQPSLDASSAGSLLTAKVGPQNVTLAAQELWVAFPGPGTFHVKVVQMTEVLGGLLRGVQVQVLDTPLSFALRQQQDIMHIKVVVQLAATDCQDPPADSAHADSTSGSITSRPPRVAYLPQHMSTHTCAAGTCLQHNSSSLCNSTGARTHAQSKQQLQAVQLQLLSPQPGALLEADRPQEFRILAATGLRLVVGSHESGWTELQPASTGGGCSATADTAAAAGVAANSSSAADVVESTAGGLVLPRVPACYIAVLDPSAQLLQQQQEQEQLPLQPGQVLPVLGLHVAPPEQALVLVEGPLTDATGDAAASCSHSHAASLLAALDVDKDGAASRRDMLLAFRRDRQLADHLKMPAKVRAGDGSFDTFLSSFVAINRSGLGFVTLQELTAHLSRMAAASSSLGSRATTAASSSSLGSRVPTAQAATGSTAAGRPRSRLLASRQGM